FSHPRPCVLCFRMHKAAAGPRKLPKPCPSGNLGFSLPASLRRPPGSALLPLPERPRRSRSATEEGEPSWLHQQSSSATAFCRSLYWLSVNWNLPLGEKAATLPREVHSMTQKRKHYSGPEKVAILRLHLLEKQSISDLCDRFGIHPTLFYRWQKEFFENGAAACEHTGKRRKTLEEVKDRQIAVLEEKLQQKNEVLAEVMQENVQLNKELGDP